MRERPLSDRGHGLPSPKGPGTSSRRETAKCGTDVPAPSERECGNCRLQFAPLGPPVREKQKQSCRKSPTQELKQVSVSQQRFDKQPPRLPEALIVGVRKFICPLVQVSLDVSGSQDTPLPVE